MVIKTNTLRGPSSAAFEAAAAAAGAGVDATVGAEVDMITEGAADAGAGVAGAGAAGAGVTGAGAGAAGAGVAGAGAGAEAVGRSRLTSGSGSGASMGLLGVEGTGDGGCVKHLNDEEEENSERARATLFVGDYVRARKLSDCECMVREGRKTAYLPLLSVPRRSLAKRQVGVSE